MVYSLESFLLFCDDYQTAEEAAISKIFYHLQNLFAKLITVIEKRIKSMKDSNMKSSLMKLLSRAKSGLSKCKSMQKEDPELAKKLQEEADSIKKELENTGNSNDVVSDTFKNAVSKNDKLSVRIMLKDMMLVDTSLKQFGEYYRYARQNFEGELMDKYNGDEFPKEITKKTIDREFVAVVHNFCPERIKWLKNAVRELYGNK